MTETPLVTAAHRKVTGERRESVPRTHAAVTIVRRMETLILTV